MVPWQFAFLLATYLTDDMVNQQAQPVNAAGFLSLDMARYSFRHRIIHRHRSCSWNQPPNVVPSFGTPQLSLLRSVSPPAIIRLPLIKSFDLTTCATASPQSAQAGFAQLISRGF